MGMNDVIRQYPEVQDIKWVRRNKNTVHEYIDSFINRCDEEAASYLFSLLRKSSEVQSFGLSDKHMQTLTAIEECLDGDGDFESVADVFVNGGCYIYARLINLVIPEAKLFLDKEAGHVKVYLDGIYFDALHAPQKEQFGSQIKDISDDIYCLREFGMDSNESIRDNIEYIHWYLNEYMNYWVSSVSVLNSLKERIELFGKQFENIS